MSLVGFVLNFQNRVTSSTEVLEFLVLLPIGATSITLMCKSLPTVYIFCTNEHLSFCIIYMANLKVPVNDLYLRTVMICKI